MLQSGRGRDAGLLIAVPPAKPSALHCESIRTPATRFPGPSRNTPRPRKAVLQTPYDGFPKPMRRPTGVKPLATLGWVGSDVLACQSPFHRYGAGGDVAREAPGSMTPANLLERFPHLTQNV